MELNSKDKVLLDYLMHNCRLPTKYLSRVAKIPQTSVVYRIKQLERRNFIHSYGLILNFNKFNFEKYFYFISVSKAKEEAFQKYIRKINLVVSFYNLINDKNYLCMCFFSSKKERESFNKKLKTFDKNFFFNEISSIDFLPFSIFNSKLKLKENKHSNKFLKLDNIDYKLISYLSNNAREPLLSISEKIGISYDLCFYRFRRLLRNNYFSLFIAFPNPEVFSYDSSFTLIETSISRENILKILKKIPQNVYLVKLNDNKYLTQFMIKGFSEYKGILRILYSELGKNLISLKTIAIEKDLFINRYNFKFLREKN